MKQIIYYCNYRNMKRFGIQALAFTLFAVPGMALAAAGDFNAVGGFMDGLSGFISGKLVPFVFTLALIVFIYGIFQYFILGGADEDSREKGKKLMLWAIIGLVVMVSVWGIVNLLSSSLGLENTDKLLKVPGGPI
ncbi:MAG: ribose/xylose/arabinose/galactoside ABC-type transport system permease subunit [Acidimicrobiales bacterium]|jgi:ribose/xylose/arabinose/galactoside ABC-type transport system permease subunit